jgi:hypothetical protein
MSELLSGRITTAFVQSGSRFFEFPVIHGTPERELFKRVDDFLHPMESAS